MRGDGTRAADRNVTAEFRASRKDTNCLTTEGTEKIQTSVAGGAAAFTSPFRLRPSSVLLGSGLPELRRSAEACRTCHLVIDVSAVRCADRSRDSAVTDKYGFFSSG